jgi:hypothetical protein
MRVSGLALAAAGDGQFLLVEVAAREQVVDAVDAADTSATSPGLPANPLARDAHPTYPVVDANEQGLSAMAAETEVGSAIAGEEAAE